MPLIAIASLTTLPLWAALAVKLIYLKVNKAKNDKNVQNDLKNEDEKVNLQTNKQDNQMPNETKI